MTVIKAIAMAQGPLLFMPLTWPKVPPGCRGAASPFPSGHQTTEDQVAYTRIQVVTSGAAAGKAEKPSRTPFEESPCSGRLCPSIAGG
jgi:hypothetical protein